MAKLEIKGISEISEDFLKLSREVAYTSNTVTIGLDDNSRFIIYQFLVNTATIADWNSIEIQAIFEEGGTIWKPVFYWSATELFPGSIITEDDPLVAYRVRMIVDRGTAGKLPGIGIDYAPAKFMVTDPPKTDSYAVTFNKFIRKDGANEIWFPLRDSADKIYRVYYLLNGNFEELEYAGNRSRYINDSSLASGTYKYDPVMETVIINAASFDAGYWSEDADRKLMVYCDYVTGGGSKALVPIEALEEGPMFDVDAGTIIQIHPDDYAKLPQDSGDSPLDWQVFNDTPLQGGYQYWKSEYLDLAAHRYREESDEFGEGYRGSGVNFQKVGSAPDSFDKDVGNYRDFWISPEGEFVKGLWQTKARGYITFVGPPNKVIPAGIRVIAPEQVRYAADTGGSDDASLAQATALSPRIPNGGMNPAPLIIKLNPSTNNAFPDQEPMARKTAAFKPRLLVYLRENTKYLGSAHWKDVGEGYGTESEQTGVAYWL